MNKLEKSIVITALVYTVVYAFVFFNIDLMGENAFQRILPFHLLGMALSLGMLVVIIRDIYKRKFASPNSKTTWTILVLMFWPSIFIYLPKYGFKPREEIATDTNQKKYIIGFIVIVIAFFGFMALSVFNMFHIPSDDLQMLAVSGKNEKIIKLLTQKPEMATMVREQDSWSPLHGAAFNNHPETVKILANHGADVNLATCNGDTALHGATEDGYTEVVRVLLESGADPSITNSKGKTPLEIAKWYQYEEIIQLLENTQ